VNMSTKYGLIVLICMIALCDVGVVTRVLIDLPNVRNERQLLQHGMHVTGRVRSRNASRAKQQTQYYVEFEYTVAGRLYAHRSRTGEVDYDHLPQGHDIEVIYLAQDPGVCTIPVATDAGSSLQMDVWLVTLMLVGTATVAIVVHYTVKAASHVNKTTTE